MLPSITGENPPIVGSSELWASRICCQEIFCRSPMLALVIPSLPSRASARLVACSGVERRSAEPLCTPAQRNKPLAEGHYFLGITAELFNVVANPLQRGDQVHDPGNAGLSELGRRSQIGQMQISEAGQTVIHGDDYDVTEPGELGAII